MKRTNLFLNAILGFILKIFSKFKHQKFIKNTKIKGPAITLSNHTSFYDFIYTYTAIYPRRVTFLAARKMFHEKTLKTFMNLARAIPKSLMEADFTATKKTLEILKKGGIISIFPEGQISPSGETLEFNYAISKLIKKALVDVYIIRHQGAGLQNPSWSKNTFKGPVITEKYLLLTKKEVESLSTDEIYFKLRKHLYYSPKEYVEKTNNTYKLNDIKNLENLIYLCPKCHHEGLHAKYDRLWCPKCHHELVYTNKGYVGELAFNERFYHQRELVLNEVLGNDNFKMSANVRLFSIYEDKNQEVGKGTLSLNKDEFIYEGTINKEKVLKVFSVKTTPFLPSDIGRNIQIYVKDQVYQFEFEISYLPTKFVLIGEYFHDELIKNTD